MSWLAAHLCSSLFLVVLSWKPAWLALSTWRAPVLCWAGEGVLSGLQGKRRNHIKPSFCFHLSLHPGIQKGAFLGPWFHHLNPCFQAICFQLSALSLYRGFLCFPIWKFFLSLICFHLLSSPLWVSFSFSNPSCPLVGKINKRKCSVLHIHWKLWHIAFLSLQYALEILIHTQH